MRHIAITDIHVKPKRQRQEFKKKPLEDLQKSIAARGLFHAILLTEEEGKTVLVFGERRLRSVTNIYADMGSITYEGEPVPFGTIPAIFIADLSPSTQKEIEFEENDVRENLTWQERVNAIAELDEYMLEKAFEEGGKHTVTATATALRNDGEKADKNEITRVSEALILSQHLHDPEVAKAKSTKDAIKIVRKKAEAAQRAVLAERFDFERTPHVLIRGDSREEIKRLPANTYSVVVTDPPFGVGADRFGDMAGTGHNYEDTPEYAKSCYLGVLEEMGRVCTEQSVVYFFLDFRLFEWLSVEASLKGWDVWPRPLIWDKTNGMLPLPDHGPRYTYEIILMMTRGSPKILKVGCPDVLRFPMTEERLHGAQKPWELYAELISRYALPGQKVADFFAGSGPIFTAATKLKLVATGIELSEHNYNICLSRISAASDSDNSALDLLGL